MKHIPQEVAVGIGCLQATVAGQFCVYLKRNR